MQVLHIHPENPQGRLMSRAVECLRGGGVIAYPTDSCYALACGLGDKDAVERIRRLRQLDERHHFTLMCRDLSQLATYAMVENSTFRLLKALTPGPYTFILKATREVPRRLQHSKRKTIGLRVPGHVIAQAMLALAGEPVMSTSLVLPGDEWPLTDPQEIADALQRRVDLLVDGGPGGMEQTTVVDLVEGYPQVIREGLGDVRPFSS